jgi:hypothetical protein
MRLTISINKHDPKKRYYILEQNKLYASTKQELFKIIREELEVKHIHIRRNSIVCKER